MERTSVFLQWTRRDKLEQWLHTWPLSSDGPWWSWVWCCVLFISRHQLPVRVFISCHRGGLPSGIAPDSRCATLKTQKTHRTEWRQIFKKERQQQLQPNTDNHHVPSEPLTSCTHSQFIRALMSLGKNNKHLVKCFGVSWKRAGVSEFPLAEASVQLPAGWCTYWHKCVNRWDKIWCYCGTTPTSDRTDPRMFCLSSELLRPPSTGSRFVELHRLSERKRVLDEFLLLNNQIMKSNEACRTCRV